MNVYEIWGSHGVTLKTTVFPCELFYNALICCQNISCSSRKSSTHLWPAIRHYSKGSQQTLSEEGTSQIQGQNIATKPPYFLRLVSSWMWLFLLVNNRSRNNGVSLGKRADFIGSTIEILRLKLRYFGHVMRAK